MHTVFERLRSHTSSEHVVNTDIYIIKYILYIYIIKYILYITVLSINRLQSGILKWFLIGLKIQDKCQFSYW
jgi:hypothetical protein